MFGLAITDMKKANPLLQQLKEPSIVMVIVVLLLLLIYGGVSLVIEPDSDSVTFNSKEQQLGPDEWMRLYEEKKRQQDQHNERGFYRLFEYRRDE